MIRIISFVIHPPTSWLRWSMIKNGIIGAHIRFRTCGNSLSLDGKHGEYDTLGSCYSNSLSIAEQVNAESIAFPLIATGVYGFPKNEALDIALSEIGKFLLTHDMNIILVVFDIESFQISEQLMGEIDQYIDEFGIDQLYTGEYTERTDM